MLELNLIPTSRTVVAYASTNETHWDLGRLSYLKLQAHCEVRFHTVELVSEPAHPESSDRPVWDDLVRRVKNDEITLLILPSLFHVAGKNIAQLSDFLAFLEKHQVKLLTLKERIDSDRFSRSQILFIFVNRTLSFNPNKGL